MTVAFATAGGAPSYHASGTNTIISTVAISENGGNQCLDDTNLSTAGGTRYQQ